VYTEKLQRVLWEKPAPTMFGGQQSVWTPVPVDPSAAAEFDDFEDWVEFYGALKSQVCPSIARLVMATKKLSAGGLRGRAL